MSSNLMYGLIYHSGLVGSFTSIIPPGEGGPGDNLLTEDGTEIETELGIELFGEG